MNLQKSFSVKKNHNTENLFTLRVMGRPIDNCGNNIIFLIKEVLDILDYKNKVLS